MYVLKIEDNDLDILKILHSGQVFRYEIISEDAFVLIYQEHYVVVSKIGGGYQFECEPEEFQSIWYPYFGLDLDYQAINQSIIHADSRFEGVIKEQMGLRILRQDPFEMLITFIISQSKAIPQIRKLVNELSTKYGQYLGDVESIRIYSFPTSQALNNVKEEEFRDMKFGYRAPYLEDAIRLVNCDAVQLSNARTLSSEDALCMLKQIKGVGDKVASCVMLFGLGDLEAFPVDVWMRKTMIYLYDDLGVKSKDIDIQNYGKNMFGKYAGIAQQYIFEYGRQIIKNL
jgi:N-glycosylase/DNA lyase